MKMVPSLVRCVVLTRCCAWVLCVVPTWCRRAQVKMVPSLVLCVKMFTCGRPLPVSLFDYLGNDFIQASRIKRAVQSKAGGGNSLIPLAHLQVRPMGVECIVRVESKRDRLDPHS